jgi:hypothetical protein
VPELGWKCGDGLASNVFSLLVFIVFRGGQI